MGEFVKRIPATSSDFKAYMKKLHENVKHVSKIWLDQSKNQIMVDLDWSANKFGGEGGADFYLPIKRGKGQQAEELAQRMIGQSRAGFAPSDSDAVALFDMIDPVGN